MGSICVIGSGFWAQTTIISLATNVNKLILYKKRIIMFVFEEIINRRRRTMLINKNKFDEKYQFGIRLPENLFACDNMKMVLEGATLVFFILPQRYIKNLIKHMSPHVKPSIHLVSFCKGLIYDKMTKNLQTIGQYVEETLKIESTVVFLNNTAYMGNNDLYGEFLISGIMGPDIYELIRNKYCKVIYINDKFGLELVQSLKNILFCAAGIVSGLRTDYNMRIKCIENSVYEIYKFCGSYFPNIDNETIFKYSGFEDSLKTSFGGRNFIGGRYVAQTNATVSEIESMFFGQNMISKDISFNVGSFLLDRNQLDEFPVFRAVYYILNFDWLPDCLLDIF